MLLGAWTTDIEGEKRPGCRGDGCFGDTKPAEKSQKLLSDSEVRVAGGRVLSLAA